MRVFLTGATGFIGSHIIPELLGRGHQVLGLARSDAGACQLEVADVEVHRGDLEQPATLASGAAAADAVIHCAFDHNFATFFENTRKDERNIAAMGQALEGTTSRSSSPRASASARRLVVVRRRRMCSTHSTPTPASRPSSPARR